MRGLGGAALAAWLVAACSGSTKQDGATGGVAGNTTTAGAAGSSGSAGMAGSSGSAGMIGSSGSAGAAQLQGMPGAHHPDCGGNCGGSPVGDWVYTRATSCNLVPASGHPPEAQECTILLLPNSTPGEPPVRLERGPRFDLSGQPLEQAILSIREDGSFMFATVYKGTGRLQLAAQCRKLGDNTVLCGDVSAVVEPYLLGEGVGRNFTCVDDATGGCDCSYEVNLVGAQLGVWRSTPEGKLLLQPSNSLPDAPAALPATYCAGETLALGPELRIPGQSATGEPTVFERADCADGIQGPGEEGVDCGQLCPSCP